MIKVLEHEHSLDLIDLQPNYPQYEEEYDDDEDEEEHDLIVKQDFRYSCDRCGQEINWFHRYYYKCNTDSCRYSCHKYCAELPATLKHRSHQAHTLILLQRKIGWKCNVCQSHRDPEEIRYRCSPCDFDVDVNCSTALEEKRFYHPSHPHPLVPTAKPVLCECDACGKEHKGNFYHCITCPGFYIHSDCAFLPKTLLIQQATNDVFSHTHPLTLSYSFPEEDQQAKFNPTCRVCDTFFSNENLWIYKCDKCRYYTHVDCATSRGESFMSIFLSARTRKTLKNFEDIDHPNLLHLPFPDQTYSILKHQFFKENGSGSSRTHEWNIEHISHQHPLILVHTEFNDCIKATSSRINFLLCHNPMKKIELLCNGCMRPITTMPFYKCNNEDQHCNFVLHEWCTQLPAELQNHPGHPKHPLVLLTKVPKFFGVFACDICHLPCNGFVYSCVQCDYHIDVNCGFMPDKITHEAHPNHLLWRVQKRSDQTYCRASLDSFDTNAFSFSCRSCDFDLHPECAFLLPRTISHKYDKHPMNLSYFPIENHKSEYFCEICEKEFDPEFWFYHCHQCGQSIHSACAPLILECETAFYSYRHKSVYEFINIKFGGIHNTKGYHEHLLSFVQGTKKDDRCTECGYLLEDRMIFKCLQCQFAIDFECCQRLEST